MCTKKTEIPPHSDQRWFEGFEMYFVADQISKTDSWQEVFEEIDKLPRNEEIKSLLFSRFKALNFMTLLEHSLCSLFSYCHKAKLFKNPQKARKVVIKQIERFRRLTNKEAEEILEKEIESKEARIWTPHKLLFIAGYSLGNFIDLFSGQTKNFPEKEDILTKLTELNIKRNLIMHNATSSRVDIKSVAEEFLVMAEECIKILDGLISTENYVKHKTQIV